MYLKHLKTILLHKYYVAQECFKVWLYWQGIVHDLSKLWFTEFFISAKYFQWDSSPISKERVEKWYSIARLNHKAKNKHHQHYWIDIDRWNIVAVEMPNKYVLELCCDFIWAGKAYNKWNVTQQEPLAYWNKNVDKKYIHKNTVNLITAYLENYAKYWDLFGRD